MTKPQISSEMFGDSKSKCPVCLQPLTFVRTKSQSKRWYCYSCEKYVDHLTQNQTGDSPRDRRESISGLQVIDSNGMMVGRVVRTTSADTGEIKSLIVDVDKEPFRNSLRSRAMAESLEVSRENVAAIGDVVVLAKPFSSGFSSGSSHHDQAVHNPPLSQLKVKQCHDCGSVASPDSKFCTTCGGKLTF